VSGALALSFGSSGGSGIGMPSLGALHLTEKNMPAATKE